MAGTAKISITVDVETLSWMRKRARRRGGNLSAAFVEAARQMRQQEAREKLLKRLGHRRLTPEAVARIAAEWEA